MFLEVVVALMAVWLIHFAVKTWRSRLGDGPPGPIPLPLIGNLHQLGSNPPYTIDHLWRRYGDVYQITFPVGTFVVINSGKTAREALVERKDDFAGRPTEIMYPIDVILEGKNIGNGDYRPLLLFQRKVLRSALHVWGEGAKRAEARVNRAVVTLLRETEAKNGAPFHIQDYVVSAIASQLWEWLTSKRTDVRQESLKEVIRFNESITSLARQGNYYQMLPLLTYLPTEFTKKIRETVELRDKIYARELDEHLASYVEGRIRDVTDALIAAYKAETAKGLDKDMGTIEDLKFLMIDVMLAGADTSRTVVSWSILFLVSDTELQGKLQQEIDRVFGGEERLLLAEDSKCLDRLQSFVCEVLRFVSLFPWMPHRTIRDTEVGGYKIAKDTPVFVNYYRIHRDPEEFEAPDLFLAERFLDTGGHFVGWTAVSGFIPFGAGRRSCSGQDLGRMQVFAVLANLIRQFRLESPPGEPAPSIDDTVSGFINQPKSHRVVAIKRR